MLRKYAVLFILINILSIPININNTTNITHAAHDPYNPYGGLFHVKPNLVVQSSCTVPPIYREPSINEPVRFANKVDIIPLSFDNFKVDENDIDTNLGVENRSTSWGQSDLLNYKLKRVSNTKVKMKIPPHRLPNENRVMFNQGESIHEGFEISAPRSFKSALDVIFNRSYYLDGRRKYKISYRLIEAKYPERYPTFTRSLRFYSKTKSNNNNPRSSYNYLNLNDVLVQLRTNLIKDNYFSWRWDPDYKSVDPKGNVISGQVVIYPGRPYFIRTASKPAFDYSIALLKRNPLVNEVLVWRNNLLPSIVSSVNTSNPRRAGGYYALFNAEGPNGVVSEWLLGKLHSIPNEYIILDAWVISPQEQSTYANIHSFNFDVNNKITSNAGVLLVNDAKIVPDEEYFGKYWSYHWDLDNTRSLRYLTRRQRASSGISEQLEGGSGTEAMWYAVGSALDGAKFEVLSSRTLYLFNNKQLNKVGFGFNNNPGTCGLPIIADDKVNYNNYQFSFQANNFHVDTINAGLAGGINEGVENSAIQMNFGYRDLLNSNFDAKGRFYLGYGSLSLVGPFLIRDSEIFIPEPAQTGNAVRANINSSTEYYRTRVNNIYSQGTRYVWLLFRPSYRYWEE